MLSKSSLSHESFQEQRHLKVLQEVEQNPNITQRSLAAKLGVALGLTNLYIKRLAHKGYIKISTLPKGRIKYLLTPKGISEKSRLTYEYLQYSLSYYRDMRHRYQNVLAHLGESGARRILIFGIGELAELGYLFLQGSKFTLIGFITPKPQKKFLSYPCIPVDALQCLEFDAILICEIADVDETKAMLQAVGVPRGKVFTVV